MKVKFFLILLFVSFFLSCRNEKKPAPSVLLSEPQMVDVITDVQIMEGIISYKRNSNQKTAYITVPVPEYKMPQYIASPSVTAFILPKSFFVGAGVDVDYWEKHWQYELSVGYGIHASDGVATPGYYALIKAKYNLFQK